MIFAPLVIEGDFMGLQNCLYTELAISL